MSVQARGPRSRVLTTMRLLAKPFEWFPKWRERYGDPMRLPTLNGNVFLTGQPELIKQIFATKPLTYGPFATEAVSGFAGSGSMLVLTGERHLAERKLLSPPFRGSQMRALGPAMADAAQRRLSAAVGAGTLRVGDIARDISLEAIIRTVFGVQERERVEAFADAVTEYLRRSNPLFFFTKASQTRLFPPWRAYLVAFDRLDALLQEQIERVRSEPAQDNILASMVSAQYDDGSTMDDEHIKGELRTLLFAGHDTTAITLTWAVDHVFRDPALVERLREHVDGLDGSVESYAASETLASVWKETLRLHPVITEVLRTCEEPMTLGEVDVPAGDVVSASICLVHLDPELYPDPHRFDPERFVGTKPPPHEYLPFGGGHRRCLGAAFAGYQLQVVLGVLLRDYDVQLQEPTPPKPVRSNVTIAPKGEVPVVISKR